MDQCIGKLLDNRYEILELIGSGGMARVYKARDHRLNRLVAIKVLREDLSQDAEFRRRFHDESQAVAMLSHPNIVAVYDVSRSSELEYIVMELIDGITLKQYMQKKGNKLNWREALHFITQIVKALGHAHSRGIIHRDIKPHNIMVLRDGSVKVADFGIARVASSTHSTLTQEALGSVHYISPEQARGSYIDSRSDLYSAGVVLYEMITGRLPFEGDTPVSVAIQHINSIPLSPREIDPSIPEALEEITMKAMAPNPDNRYLSADEMLYDLEEFRKNPNINFEYHMADFMEPEDDGDKTQIRPAYSASHSSIPSGGTSRRRRAEPEYEDDDDYDDYDDYDDRRRGSPWPIVIAVMLILVVIGGVVMYVYRNFVQEMLAPPQQYDVPSVVGMLLNEAAADTELLGKFRLEQGEVRADDSPEGTILSQDPVANTQVLNPETTIVVVTSGGPEELEMIPVVNLEYYQVSTRLENMGLKVHEPEFVYSSEVENGKVISATPEPGTIMHPGDEVYLVVSKGPEAKTVKVEDYIGQTSSWAESRLKLLNLEAHIIPTYSDDHPVNQVIDQNPAAGEEVEPGTTVNLMVSQGPDPSAQPEEITKTVVISLPPEIEPPLRVQVVMDNNTIYDEIKDPMMDTAVEVTVSAPAGSGTKVLTGCWTTTRP